MAGGVFGGLMKDYFTLTAREIETLKFLSEGLSNKEIMEKMFIARTTLSTYLYSIYGKLGISSGKGRASEMRVQAVLWYFKNVKHIDLESEN